MQILNKWNKFIITAGGVLFLIQGFFLFLYWNWSFGSSADRSYLPFIGVTVSMLGYLFALWKGKYGGLIMISGALILAISIFINPKEIELSVRILFILISCVPTAVIGGLFIYQETKNKIMPA